MSKVELKTKDLVALADAFYDNLRIDDCEYGGIGLDSKRPFGNSDADSDILEIIAAVPEDSDEGWSDEQRDYARSLYDALPAFLRERWARLRDLQK